MTPVHLPSDTELPIQQLSRLFDRTTNSYKFLFFLALLDELMSHSHPAPVVENRTLAAGMLARAWYPIVYFRLRFGATDQMERLIRQESLHELSPEFTPQGHQLLKARILDRIGAGTIATLMRYALHRLMSPFVPDLQGVADAQKNSRITEYVRDQESAYGPSAPYVIRERDIVVRPVWAAYFRAHNALLESWTYWQWSRILQVRNPSVPALGTKLVSPEFRADLQDQKTFWRAVLRRQRIECIYTGRPVEVDFSLDHVIPWSFVGHDLLWNLVPTHHGTNSMKRDRLPDLGRILEPLARVHSIAISTFRASEKRSWPKFRELFVPDGFDARILDSTEASVLTARLADHYRQLFPNLSRLAALQGFEPWGGGRDQPDP